MNLKKYGDFPVDFKSKHAVAAGGFMGLFIFLRMLYYFGFLKFSEAGAGELILLLILPLLVGIAFLVLYSGIRLNAPGIYGILGAIFCVFLILWSLFTGDVLRIILAVLWYLLAGTMLLGTAGGFLPDNGFAAVSFGAAAVIRVLLFTLPDLLTMGMSYFPAGLNSFADVFLVLSLQCLSLSFRQKN